MSTAERFGPPRVPLADLMSYDIAEYEAWLINRSMGPKFLEEIGPISGDALRQWVAEVSSTQLSPSSNKRLMSRSELKWFNPDNYSNERLDALGPSGWMGVLTFRFFLLHLHRREPPEEVLRLFGFLQSEPLESPYVDIGHLPMDHFTDTASVRFARAAPLAYAVERLLLHKVDGHAPASPALMEIDGMPVILSALLQVDLTASRSQIRKDFNAWLKAIDRLQEQPLRRNYSTKSKLYLEWRKSKYLQCYDLDLFAELNNARIPAQLMADVLGLKVSAHGANRQDEVRVCRGCHDVFTWDTVLAMSRQRDAEALANATLTATRKPVSRAPRARRPLG